MQKKSAQNYGTSLTPKPISKAWIAVFIIGTLLACLQFARQTYGHGKDFEVFWNAARHLLNSESIYTPSTDPSRVFKYPPWCIWFFIPFGFLDLPIAKIAWGILQGLSLACVWKWLWRIGVQGKWIALTTLTFLGLLNVHAFDGQISLPGLAVLLLTLGKSGPNLFKRIHWGGLAAIAVSSSKVFSMFTLFVVPFRALWTKAFFAMVGILLLTCIPLLLRDPSDSLWGFIQSWFAAMWDGGKTLGWEGVRGKYNQGLGALILRTLEIPESQTEWDLAIALLLAVAIGGLWRKFSQKLNFHSQLVGWIALSAVIHPLPFWYTFIFALPLCAVALQSAWDMRQRVQQIGLLALAILGMIAVAAVSEKTMGSLGLKLVYLSIKSFGVLLCCLTLLWGQISRKAAQSRL